MQCIRLFLLTLATFSLCAMQVGASDLSSFGSDTSLAEMDIAARRDWVGDMLARLDEANRVVLADEAVKKQHARFEKTLAPFVEDRDGWLSQVAMFKKELVLSQRAAIEHLTRRYRLDAYRIFRTDRDAFETRRATLEGLLKGWRNAKSPVDEQYKVVRWLSDATHRTNDSNLAQLPPLPIFEGSPASSLTPRRLAQSEPARLTRMPTAGSSLVPDVLIPEASPSPQSVSTADHDDLSDPQPAQFLSSHNRSRFDWDEVRPAVFEERAKVELTPGARQAKPRPLHAFMVPSLEKDSFLASLKPANAARTSRSSWRQPSSIASVTRPMSQMARPRLATREMTPMTSRTRDPLAFARTKVDRLTMVSTTRRGLSSDNMGTLSSGTPNPATFGFAQQRSASVEPNKPATENNHQNPLSTDDEKIEIANSSSPDRITRSQVVPNLDELASRIRGNNVAMQKLAAQLYEERDWDVRSLTTFYDQLAPLVARKEDLKLIRGLIPPQQRQQVGDLESGSDLISDLGSKIAKARSAAAKTGRSSSTTTDEKELEQLDYLSKKLANLVFGN